MEVFHCYEFLLMRRFQEDKLLWDGMKTESCTSFHSLLLSIRNQAVLRVECVMHPAHFSADLWFLAVALEKSPHRLLEFLTDELLKDEDRAARIPGQTVLARYLNHYNFVEMHLDSIFKYGETATLPRELFKCKNVRILSLKSNNLESIPADVGRLRKLERLSLTNNRLQNRSIPFTLTFCTRLQELYLDNNLLDALPGFLLSMPQLKTVHRHGNHNYFKATFMWYHTDVNDRVMRVSGEPGSQKKQPPPTRQPPSLLVAAAAAVIASKLDFFADGVLPNTIQDLIADVYPSYNVCENCQAAKATVSGGFKVFTFKNPYLGNTCVPFQHWACSRACAEDIEVPAHLEQQRAARRMDSEYNQYINEFQRDRMPAPSPAVQGRSACTVL